MTERIQSLNLKLVDIVMEFVHKYQMIFIIELMFTSLFQEQNVTKVFTRLEENNGAK